MIREYSIKLIERGIMTRVLMQQRENSIYLSLALKFQKPFLKQFTEVTLLNNLLASFMQFCKALLRI